MNGLGKATTQERAACRPKDGPKGSGCFKRTDQTPDRNPYIQPTSSNNSQIKNTAQNNLRKIIFKTLFSPGIYLCRLNFKENINPAPALRWVA